MKKFLVNLLVIVYAIIAIFVTVCLLSFNEHRVTVFGNYSLVIIDSNEIKGDYKKGSLVIVSNDPKPEAGEKTFFYNVMGQNEIALAEVTSRQDYKNTESTYTFGGESLVTQSSIIGSVKNAKEIPYAGTVLRILESKWGYLFLVVLVSLLMFLYEITKAVEDVKNSKRELKELENEDKKIETKPQTESVITEEKNPEKIEASKTVTETAEEVVKEEPKETTEEKIEGNLEKKTESLAEETTKVQEVSKEEKTEPTEENTKETEEKTELEENSVNEENTIETDELERVLDELDDEDDDDNNKE